jgi:hypothetical protein
MLGAIVFGCCAHVFVVRPTMQDLSASNGQPRSDVDQFAGSLAVGLAETSMMLCAAGGAGLGGIAGVIVAIMRRPRQQSSPVAPEG